ncbi:hypothetical protein TNCV_4770351 [Trichonephila clavipes]|nr:hypothetical protein TNCV_4770351 [Trichonephila clavipes]
MPQRVPTRHFQLEAHYHVLPVWKKNTTPGSRPPPKGKREGDVPRQSPTALHSIPSLHLGVSIWKNAFPCVQREVSPMTENCSVPPADFGSEIHKAFRKSLKHYDSDQPKL